MKLVWRQVIADEQAAAAAKHQGTPSANSGAGLSSPEAPLTEPSPRPPVSPAAAGAAPIVSTGAAIAWHTPQQPEQAGPASLNPTGSGSDAADAVQPGVEALADMPLHSPTPASVASTVPDEPSEDHPQPSQSVVDQHGGHGARGLATEDARSAEGLAAAQQAAAAAGTPATPRQVSEPGGTPASFAGTRPSQTRHSRLLHMTPQANAMAAGSYASPGRSPSRPSRQSMSPSDAARRSSLNVTGAVLSAANSGPSAWRGGPLNTTQLVKRAHYQPAGRPEAWAACSFSISSHTRYSQLLPSARSYTALHDLQGTVPGSVRQRADQSWSRLCRA